MHTLVFRAFIVPFTIYWLSACHISRGQLIASTGKATSYGTCSSATSGKSNVYIISCKVNITQGAKLMAVLNKIAANQLDPNLVMAKLDEIIAAARSTQTQQCIGGSNCVQGGTQNIDNRQFGTLQALPKLLGLEIFPLEPKPAPRQARIPGYDPGVPRYGSVVAFTIDRSWLGAMFRVQCSRPCVPSSIEAGNLIMYPVLTMTTDPSVVTYTVNSIGEVQAGAYFKLQVRSRDDQPVSIVDVQPVRETTQN